MSNAWDDMRKAKEDTYFDRLNKEALQRFKNRGEEKPRLSPITGEQLVQETLCGVVIDRCPTSGGIWLDAGELEQLVENFRSEKVENTNSLFAFIGKLAGGSSEEDKNDVANS